MFFDLFHKTDSGILKFKCIEKMSHMTIALVNMYHLLPEIAQNVPLDMINSNNKRYYYNDKDLSVY